MARKTAAAAPEIAPTVVPAPKTVVHLRTDVAIYFGVVEDGNVLAGDPATLTMSCVTEESLAVLLQMFGELRDGFLAQANAPAPQEPSAPGDTT